MRSFLFIAVGITCLAFVCGEAAARYWLGLGKSVLSIEHPKIEYMFKPNQNILKFGNRHIYNEIGMRSPEMATLHQPRRVMVFGDSVLNGGNLTDHADLATTLATTDEVFFGNVSAGSWGPQNIGAWIDKFGFQGADTAILVLSSHDLNDLPTFEPLNPKTHPTEQPLSGLLEGITRYLPRYLPNWLKDSFKVQPGKTQPNISPSLQNDEGSRQVQLLLDRMANAGVAVCLVQHRTRTELYSGADMKDDALTEAFIQRGVPFLDDGPLLSKAIKAGEMPYRDDIHINSTGQFILTSLLIDCADKALIAI